MTKHKRLVCRVSYSKLIDGWVVIAPKEQIDPPYPLKKSAVKAARCWAIKTWRTFKIPAQVVIHKKDGKIQTEYTYGLDPRRSKG